MKTKIKNQDHWHELRAKTIGASESAALFDASPYLTPYTLWHNKRHGSRLAESESMMIGRHMEASIASAGAEKYGIELIKPDFYLSDGGLGASLDYMDLANCPVEIKNTSLYAARTHWGHPDNIQIPLHYRIQLQQQMGLMGAETSTVIVLIGGCELHMLTEPFNQKFFAKLRRLAGDFWQSIEADDPPEITSSLDYDAICSDLSPKQKGPVDMSHDAVYNDIAVQLQAVECEKKALRKLDVSSKILKAKLLHLLGDIDSGKAANGLIIKRSIVPESIIKAGKKSAYTRVTVTLPKEDKTK